jgi:hypothetical protein
MTYSFNYPKKVGELIADLRKFILALPSQDNPKELLARVLREEAEFPPITLLEYPEHSSIAICHSLKIMVMYKPQIHQGRLTLSLSALRMRVQFESLGYRSIYIPKELDNPGQIQNLQKQIRKWRADASESMDWQLT